MSPSHRTPPKAAHNGAIPGLLQRGLALHQAGRGVEAAVIYEQILGRDAHQPAANHLLGLVRLQQGRVGEAVSHLAAAVKASPQDAQYLSNLGVALNAAERNEEAAIALRRAIGLDPKFAEAYSNLGMAFRALQKTDNAVDAYRNAVRLKPNEAGFHFNLANSLSDAGDILAAEAAYRRAIALRLNYGVAIAALAKLLDDEGRSSEALALVDRALAAHPKDARLHLRRARSLHRQGHLESAIQSFDRALQLDPSFGEAHLQRSYAIRHEQRDLSIDEMERLFRSDAAPLDDRIFAGFGLGKALTDLGEHQQAINAFTDANRLHRQRTAFSLERAAADLRNDVDRFVGMPDPKADAGFRDDAPIFVIGLPRSGKSTIEAILARHPTVQGAGELPTMGRLVRQLAAEYHAVPIVDIPPGRLTELGRAYMHEVQQLVPSDRTHVDTMPSNYRHVGFIRHALPNARIIFAARSQADHCVAIFEKYLTGRGYEYANDMDELRPYHAAFSDMMASWHARFPGSVYDIDLGNLAVDRQGELRKLLEFCGLAWDDACVGEVRSEPQYHDWSSDRVARNRAEHLAAWREVHPQLWD